MSSTLSNFNCLLFTMDTGASTDTISDSCLTPRDLFTTRQTVVLSYPVNNTHIVCRISYVSNTQIKIKMSDANRGVYVYGMK